MTVDPVPVRDEHLPIPYLEREYQPTGEIMIDQPDKSSDAIRMIARCPACHGASRRTYRRGRPMGNQSSWPAGGVTAATRTPVRTVTVICSCGHPHPHRPTEVSEPGCGAFWRVTLR